MGRVNSVPTVGAHVVPSGHSMDETVDWVNDGTWRKRMLFFSAQLTYWAITWKQAAMIPSRTEALWQAWGREMGTQETTHYPQVRTRRPREPQRGRKASSSWAMERWEEGRDAYQTTGGKVLTSCASADPQRGHLEQSKASWMVKTHPHSFFIVLDHCPQQVLNLDLHKGTS